MFLLRLNTHTCTCTCNLPIYTCTSCTYFIVYTLHGLVTLHRMTIHQVTVHRCKLTGVTTGMAIHQIDNTPVDNSPDDNSPNKNDIFLLNTHCQQYDYVRG